MELKDFLKEYWPIFVGVVVVLVTAVIFWPSEEPPSPPGSDGIVRYAAPTGSTNIDRELAEREREQREKKVEREPREVSSEKFEKSLPSPEPQMLEIVEAVILDQPAVEEKNYAAGDPEVKQALSEMEVTFYQASDCSSCRSTLATLEKNGLSVKARNVDDDSNDREKARRISGGTSLPVLVVDGIVVEDTSALGLEAALTRAVKKRVEARTR